MNYSQIEIFKIIQNCRSHEELEDCAKGFAHLLVIYDQPGGKLIKRLLDIREKSLDEGPSV